MLKIIYELIFWGGIVSPGFFPSICLEVLQDLFVTTFRSFPRHSSELFLSSSLEYDLQKHLLYINLMQHIADHPALVSTTINN